MSKRVFFPYLDTLRFVAFFIVYCSHCVKRNTILAGTSLGVKVVNLLIQTIASLGAEGVHIFFVLSGFLITYLLIEEIKKTNTISVKKFYLRRFLRIWPLYFLIAFISLVVLTHLLPSVFPNTHNKLLAFTFLSNFDSIYYGNHPAQNRAWVVAWSVCIEEQFYIFFPVYFLLTYFFRTRYYIMTGLIISFSIVLFFFFDEQAHYNTFLNIWLLMLGSVGAYHINYDNDQWKLLNVSRNYSIPILLATILLLLVRGLTDHGVGEEWMYFSTFLSIVLGFLYLFIIFRICFGVPLPGKLFLLTNKLGLFSYGMYFYHAMIILFVRVIMDKLHIDYDKNLWLLWVIAVAAFFWTLAVSYFSYNYFEKVFLKLKERFTIVHSGNRN